MKITKAQIDKERKTKDLYDEIMHGTSSFDGDINTLESRIKNEIKNSYKFQKCKWADGTKFKLSECKIDSEHCGYDGGEMFKIIATKTVPETDKEVIDRLKKNEAQRVRRKGKLAIQEKREKSLLATLKKKYGEEA